MQALYRRILPDSAFAGPLQAGKWFYCETCRMPHAEGRDYPSWMAPFWEWGGGAWCYMPDGEPVWSDGETEAYYA